MHFAYAYHALEFKKYGDICMYNKHISALGMMNVHKEIVKKTKLILLRKLLDAFLPGYKIIFLNNF
jgi:hypothetical protein